MGVELLLEDLQAKSVERVAAIWRKAEEDAAKMRKEQEMELAAADERMARHSGEAGREVAEPVIREAEIKALRIQDDVCRELAGRLYRLATGQLDLVRQEEYPAIFADLVAELPEISWSEVRVAPPDLDLARYHFPGAEIRSDPAITGGFTAECNGGRYRVINTLELRLERAWPFVLPLLLRAAEEEAHAAPAG
jgi:vacuolar-type H+-ATPase subunit E/Vma4